MVSAVEATVSAGDWEGPASSDGTAQLRKQCRDRHFVGAGKEAQRFDRPQRPAATLQAIAIEDLPGPRPGSQQLRKESRFGGPRFGMGHKAPITNL